MKSHKLMHKHTKNKFIQSISRLISLTEITLITTTTLLFNSDIDALVICQRGDI